MGKPREISASDFKARCLGLLDEVRDRGLEVVVTKHGLPVARVIPIGSERQSLRRAWKDTAHVRGDIVHVDWSSDFEANR